MQIITFEAITGTKLSIVKEIVDSNKCYNLLENGRGTRSLEELKGEFLNSSTQSVFIKCGSSYIGVIDFLDNNPKDGFPWIGLLMIHKDFQGKGYAKQAYKEYEKKLLLNGISAIRLGVLIGNERAKNFWESMGFVYVETKAYKEKREVVVYEKVFSKR
ncbi:N-acetyltransferase [uncultured Metabacillus sp.]|uniref:GNAT family N-acetyltransferase n=1 Tax=uncultured Metabacillus sp. TaxID=2860135 RepID=UPI002608E357|nr:GNAT family N-acetyltransferase [uncultured Metabacillus sp.]